MNDQESMPATSQPVRIFRGLALAALVALAAALAVLLLAGVWKIFVSIKDVKATDYVRYTAMLWNSAHGRLFEVAPGISYLRYHLSFSLLLLAPLFWLTENAFLLGFVQWLFLVGGAMVLFMVGRRANADPLVTGAIAVFYVGCSFAQTVLFYQFHGIAAYFLLLPWLYYCLQKRSHSALVPLLITLGLREEAGLYMIPLLLFAGWRYAWRPAFYYAAGVIAYVAVACLVLFPVINGDSLFHVRAVEIGLKNSGRTAHMTAWIERLKSLGWIMLPLVPFLAGRGRRAILVIPSLAIACTLLSSFAFQYKLERHYPAVVLASMAVAMVAASGQLGSKACFNSKTARAATILWLLLATGISYYRVGFLPGSRKGVDRINLARELDGEHALWVARNKIPRGVTLATEPRFSSFVAARRGLDVNLFRDDGKIPTFDFVWMNISLINQAYRDAIRDHVFSVRYADDVHVVLERGGACSANEEFLQRAQRPVALFYGCAGQADDEFVPGEGVLRHWRGGRGLRRFAVDRYHIELPAGSSIARLHFRSEAPSGTQTNWGRCILALHGTTHEIAAAEILPSPAKSFRTQDLAFRLAESGKVDISIIGADASLWLRKVEFISAPSGD